MTKQIVVLSDYERIYPSSPKVAELEKKGYSITYHHHKITEEAEVVSLLKEADIAVLIRERVNLSADVLKKLPSLQMISQTGGGAAHIDLDQAEKQGITITLTGSTSRPSVVELTFGLMIACARQFTPHQQNLQQDKWIQYPGMELQNKRLGLLGYGKIAREVALVAESFNIEVVAWRPTGKKGDEHISILELEEVLSTSDIVSVHLKLVPELRGILNQQHLNLMKKGSIFINTARGALVDTKALVELLESGHLYGAGIDTFEEEPLVQNPFKNCPNVVLTPHIGYVTTEVLERFAEQSLQNILDHDLKSEMK
ncbi:NAD(P)-dependent oxidoreductase [Ornithinibacillus sp. 4-3]|uniref:NAD(P)-dependent oxidoreductase n=1 Tax=Ornithinibacillus sp. 4-3 TaxID=3231488 RepID=A0AB39HRE1_9BACI